MNAFEKYLISVPQIDAAAHLYQCLSSPEGGELAWDLMARIHGDNWSVAPDKLGQLLMETVEKLHKEAQNETA